MADDGIESKGRNPSAFDAGLRSFGGGPKALAGLTGRGRTP
jgi:hypothetical protein